MTAAAAVDVMLHEAAGHYNAGRPEPADALCGDILAAQPDHIPALHLAAIIALTGGRTPEGLALLGRVFDLHPDYVPGLITLGDALAVKGEHDGAAMAFQRAITLRPMDAMLHAKLGVTYSDLGRFGAAEDRYRKALELDPLQIRPRFNLAVALAKQQRFAEAEQVYLAVIAHDPHHRGAWLNLGNLLSDQKRLADSVAAYQRALKSPSTDPALRDVVVLTNLAGVLCEIGQVSEAIAACERAITLEPAYALAHTNLGFALDRQGDIDAALAAHQRAIAIDPAFAQGHANLAVALRTVGRLDEAFAASHRAVACESAAPEARFNHAHFLLMNGQFERGFDELRWGKSSKHWADSYPAFAQPEWDGENLAGRTLLLFAEAGLGDTLQFVRYLPMVAAKGGPIVLQVQPPLVPLLRTMQPAIADVTIVARGEALPSFDHHFPLMRLPHIFGTRVDSVPADIPYLHADPAKLARWRGLLGNNAALKVGVVWAGNPKHKGDRHRSLPADAVLPRLVMPGVQLYSLQKEYRSADLPVLARLGADIIDLAPLLIDFTDTAAAVAALDLVISVDTSVAHLAGAMGRPTWMLLPHALDWRWLRDREDSPWYPSLRLFRQQKPGAWDSVLARVTEALRKQA